MQFVQHGYPFGYAPNASQQQSLQQQSPHPSQPPSTATTQVEQQQQQPAQTQPLALPPGMPNFGQPVMPAPPVELNAQGKVKRKQVKNACVNCQKACKKCDDGRPCQRCIKYGLTDTCVNSVRKERKKGIKRGPYKKRKQADGTPASTSTSAAAATATASSLPSALYGTSAQATAGTRTNGVLAYQPFHSGTYDPFHAAAVSYQNSGPMMPYAHMVPAIQQMYPGNAPMLSYQAAMNMLSPQHGQAAPNLYGGYRLPEQQDQQQQQHDRSHEGSPAASNGVNETAVKAEGNTADSDDEGSKLNILSQLCSAVLDRTDAPAATKQEPEQHQQQQQQQVQQQPEQQQQQQQQQQTEQPSAAATATTTTEAEQNNNAPSTEQSSAVKEEQA